MLETFIPDRAEFSFVFTERHPRIVALCMGVATPNSGEKAGETVAKLTEQADVHRWLTPNKCSPVNLEGGADVQVYDVVAYFTAGESTKG